jgi:Flp pilus assembly protein TadD
VTVAAVASLALPWLADRQIDKSYSASDAGNFQQAVDHARSARSLNPLSPEPLYALASAYVTVDDTAAARGAYESATRLQPENPDTWFRLGLFHFIDTGDMCAAYQALNHAYTLDPRNTHWTPNSELEKAKAAVNDPDNPACGR